MLTGFALLDVAGFGLFLLPFAVAGVVAALWRPDSGPWGAAFGAFLALGSVLGQLGGALYVPHVDAPDAPAERLTVPVPWLLVFGGGAIIALVGAVLWPRAGSTTLMIAGAATGWVVLGAPGVSLETGVFILPGATLLTAGAARSLLEKLRTGRPRLPFTE